MEPDYDKIQTRILEILEADTTFKPKIAEFRFGEISQPEYAKEYPLCYVTTPPNPEISRETIGPAKFGHLPAQEIETEFWIVVVVSGPTPADTQKKLYELRADILRILGKNTQLRDPASFAQGSTVDPDMQCASLNVEPQRRFNRSRGKLLDGITFMIHTFHFVNSPE